VEPLEAALTVLREEGEPLHWTKIQDLALRRGYIDPFETADVRRQLFAALADGVRSGVVVKESRGVYQLGRAGVTNGPSAEPSDVVRARSWLIGQGFELYGAETDMVTGESFSDYQRGAIAVRIVAERDGWYLLIRAPGGENGWYDASIWRAYLDGNDPEPTPDLNESLQFLTSRLAEVDHAMERREATSKGVAEAGLQRARRELNLPE
jgi:hypothetical protein